MTDGLLGCIQTPLQGNAPVQGARWCADNGRYGNGWRGFDYWFGWLQRQTDRMGLCEFAVAPDVVGDAVGTLRMSRPWLPKIRDLGFPAAFVAQDGSDADRLIPWGEFDVLFVGGSTGFKTGPVPARLADAARARGVAVHMGRVNSLRRLRWASWVGCDTADGTFLTFGPDKNLARMLRFLRTVNDQPRLFDREAT